jgi:hypothetical protein
MRGATKRALEGPAENQEPDGPKLHAARQRHAASVQAGSDSVVEQVQLLRQDPPRALPARGRVRSEENPEVRTKERSPRPLAKSQGRMGEQQQIVPRRLFPGMPPTLRGEFKHLVEFPSVGVLPNQGTTQALSAPMPAMLQLPWLSSGQTTDATGVIRKALEIADRAQNTSSQSNDVLQVVQQNVQMNFKMNPPEASAFNEQKLQLEWEAMQLKQQKNELELAAYQQKAVLNQRAMEVANMETSSRHQAIQKILYLECEAQNYVRHYEIEAEKLKNQ